MKPAGCARNVNDIAFPDIGRSGAFRVTGADGTVYRAVREGPPPQNVTGESITARFVGGVMLLDQPTRPDPAPRPS